MRRGTKQTLPEILRVEQAKKYVPHIMDCAHAMNRGDLDRAWLLWENFKEIDNPLAKAVGARLFLHDDRVAEARQLLLDAISKIKKENRSALYVLEYCKVFLVDFPSKEDLEAQIRKALSINHPASIFNCLVLFEDLGKQASHEV